MEKGGKVVKAPLKRAKPLEFDFPKDPIKFLGMHPSYDQTENSKRNLFLLKSRKWKRSLTYGSVCD